MYKSKTIYIFLNDQKLILLKLFFWTEELFSFLFIWVGKTTYFISIGTFHLNRLSVFFEDTFEQELLCRDWFFDCFVFIDFFNITFFVAKKVWESIELISKLVHQCYIIWANRFTCILIVKVVKTERAHSELIFFQLFSKKKYSKCLNLTSFCEK